MHGEQHNCSIVGDAEISSGEKGVGHHWSGKGRTASSQDPSRSETQRLGRLEAFPISNRGTCLHNTSILPLTMSIYFGHHFDWAFSFRSTCLNSSEASSTLYAERRYFSLFVPKHDGLAVPESLSSSLLMASAAISKHCWVFKEEGFHRFGNGLK